MCCDVSHELASPPPHPPPPLSPWNLLERLQPFLLCQLSVVKWQHSRVSKDDFKKSAFLSVCHHFLQPEATRTIFDLEAGMSFWALDYQNPAHFNVVSVLPETGHCYRLNHLRQCKKETVCVPG